MARLIYSLVMCWCVALTYSAPRSKSKTAGPQTVYDQKQTGDYNIQLHLKDFQIIALMADDSIGGLGDYEYNYDYADFTIKPSTQKPSESTTTSPINNSFVSIKPTNHPYPIIIPVNSSPTEKPILTPKPNITKEDEQKKKPSTTPIPKPQVVEIIESSTVNIDSPLSEETENSPGKIKVQILETPISPPVGIVPGEDLGDSNEALPLGDVMLKKCMSGYSRDKRGRCRRLRRPGNSPQLPFGIGRIANNLVARFRYAAPDSTIE